MLHVSGGDGALRAHPRLVVEVRGLGLRLLTAGTVARSHLHVGWSLLVVTRLQVLAGGGRLMGTLVLPRALIR